MLFRSQVPGIFQQMNMELDQAANRARKADARKRLDFYHDTQVDYIQEQLELHFSNPEKLTPYFVNIVKKVINNLAMVYGQPAVREVEGESKDGDIFKEIVESSALPVKVKMASRYTKLLKTILIRPVWRKGKLDLDILTGEILDVETGESPEDLKSVLVTHYPESQKQDQVEFSFWSDESFKRLDYRGNVIKEEGNPYKVLPFVPLFDRCPTNDFWLSGGDDLICNQEGINEKLTDLLYVLRQQGFGVGWIKKKTSGGGGMLVDPGSLVELPEDGALGYESQKAPIKEILSAIDFLITQAAISNGLSVSTLSTKVVRESGLAKVQGQRELEELRRDDIILWRKYEQQTFNMCRAVWNTHNPGRKISDKAKLKVDFYDPKPVISAKDQAETWRELISLGVISPIDVVMERNPDLKSRNEAKEFLLKVKQENDLFRGAENADL